MYIYLRLGLTRTKPSTQCNSRDVKAATDYIHSDKCSGFCQQSKPASNPPPIAANKRLQVNTEVTLLLDYCPVLSQPAHRCDQQSGHLFFCTHPQITVWVIVADNPNYA